MYCDLLKIKVEYLLIKLSLLCVYLLLVINEVNMLIKVVLVRLFNIGFIDIYMLMFGVDG